MDLSGHDSASSGIDCPDESAGTVPVVAKRKHPHVSLWTATAPRTSYPSLPAGVTVDVAVLGGGMAGLTTALLLKEAGLRVAVIEAERIALGATAGSTVKVTAGHGLIYAELDRRFGLDVARTYAEANAAGLRSIAEIVDRLSIECDFERRPNHVWAETAEERQELEHAVSVEQAVGLPSSLLSDAPELTFPVTGLLRMEDQAQFHPRRFLLGVAAAVDGEGSAIYERTRAVGIEAGSPCRVTTDRGELEAGHVVVATHYPFPYRGFFFAKLYPKREYAVAMPVQAGRVRGMYINAGDPTRSIRQAPGDDGDLLVVVGEGHKVGEGSPSEERYGALESWAGRHFGVKRTRYRWSTQDNMSMDHLPFVGRISRGSPQVWVATGFGTWGMTNAAASAMMIRDGILGESNPWAEVFDAQRLTPRQSARMFTTENSKVAAHFVGDRLRAVPASVSSLRPGEGRVIRRGIRPVAVSRDDAGRLHAVSATCTHLGCLVAWNAAERSWDCPCHGSRFGMDGEILHAPATKPLERLDIAQDEAAGE